MQDSPEVRKWERRLDKKSVEITDYSFRGFWLRCKDCGDQWSPMIRSGGGCHVVIGNALRVAGSKVTRSKIDEASTSR